MNLFYEVLFASVRVYMVLCVLFMAVMVGTVCYERYVKGNVHAFKPERRMGPADRRAGLPSH